MAGVAAASAGEDRAGGGRIVAPQFARSELVKERRVVSRPETLKVAERYYRVKSQAVEVFSHPRMEGLSPRVPMASRDNAGYRTGQGGNYSGFNNNTVRGGVSGFHGGSAARYHSVSTGFPRSRTSNYGYGRRHSPTRLDRGDYY